MDRKIKVELIDGTSEMANAGFLSYELRNQILKECTKTKLINGVNESELDIFSLQTETLKRVLKGVNVGMIKAESGDEIFYNYYSKCFGLGEDLKNSKKSSE